MDSRPYKKKLIEVALPLEIINSEAKREKSIRHGHPSTLHLWWARRPLAACRAVIFAQLVDDPSEYVDELLGDENIRARAEKKRKHHFDAKKEDYGTHQYDDSTEPTLKQVAIDIERKRLFDLIRDLVKWEHSTDERVLRRALKEIRRSCEGNLPSVYDPFSGGGAIPLEAQRLGLNAYGSDLNPVAVMIGKSMIEIPKKFSGVNPVNPSRDLQIRYQYAQGLAKDVDYYSDWMLNQARERVGYLYPEASDQKSAGGGGQTVIAWIWARTVPSPNPAFSHVDVPLVSSFLLYPKKGKEVWIEPDIDISSKTINYRIRKNGSEQDIENAKYGTKAGKGANFRCIFSNSTITSSYIKKIGKEGRIGQALIAIVSEGDNGRNYLEPNDYHRKVALSSELRVEADVLRNDFLSGNTPERLSGGTCYSYGLDQWGKLFTDRQLYALNTFLELVHEAREKIHNDAIAAGMNNDGESLESGGAGALAYAEAVSVYLAFILDKCVDYWSSICTWHSSVQAIRNTFGRQALPMSWDFAESNPFCGSSGSWTSMRRWVWKAVARFHCEGNGQVDQFDAQSVQYPAESVIATDPPYYDNICYADLSDYFFPWMKSSVGPVYSDSNLFKFISTPKREELVAARYRHDDAKEAEKFFLDGMRSVIKNMSKQSSSDYPVTIFYAFKQSEIKKEGTSSKGWATFLQAVVDAGYAVVGTWPMRTEMTNRMIALGTNALATSVVLVCRKRDREAKSITRAEFVQALKRDIPLSISEFKAANISPADLPQSAIGPGIGIFSRSRLVLEPNDSKMTVDTALQLINAICDEYIEGIKGEFDVQTRFAVRWFAEFGLEEGDYDTAHKFALAAGISVDDVKRYGIIESASGKVRLLAPGEVGKIQVSASERDTIQWECLRHLAYLHQTEGVSADTIEAFEKLGTREDSIKELAYVLYDIAVNKRGNASEGIVYNAIGADWAELRALAAQREQQFNLGIGEQENG